MTTIAMSAPAVAQPSVQVSSRIPAGIPVAGLFAIAAGLIYAGIQPIHPVDALASVTTGTWTAVISLKLAACLFFLIGIAGLHARQASKSGWLGLAGFTLFSLSWWLQASFVFVELLILPPLASSSPDFVTSFLGIFNSHPGPTDVSGIASAYSVVGLLYLGGGILLGIATLRAGVLPRTPSVVLAIATLATPAAALLPHEIQRFAAEPVGLAFVWLGLALWFGWQARSVAGANQRRGKEH